MKIIEEKNRDTLLIRQLVDIWESSVKATHLFLSCEEIERIKSYVPQALTNIPHLVVAREDEGLPIAFMGVEQQKLEMLFLSPQKRGQGLGRELLQFGIQHYDINSLGVNEQNPQARGFYEHMGFRVYTKNRYR